MAKAYAAKTPAGALSTSEQAGDDLATTGCCNSLPKEAVADQALEQMQPVLVEKSEAGA